MTDREAGLPESVFDDDAGQNRISTVVLKQCSCEMDVCGYDNV